jgi:chromosome segregation ATPase
MFLVKIKKYLIIAGFLAAAGFALFKYYEYTQNQIRIYAENAAKAEMAQQETQAALAQTLADLQQVQEKFTQVSSEFEAAESRVSGLENKLKEHDLPYLAEQKPGLIDKIVDKGTKDVLRCLEIVSGSPLTEEEINVTKKSKANTTCPDIANPNYVPIN